MRQKPTFIGIGGHKCASTWVSECLREHPSVFMSNPKEIGYFSKYSDKGINWYLDYFKDSKSFKVKGEFSATYLYDAEIPIQIQQQLGNVKIICLVRNPIERTISHLKQLNRKNQLNFNVDKFSIRQLQDAEKSFPELINYSFYAKGIINYQNTFGVENVLVLNQSYFKTESDAVLKALFDFLEIDFYKLNTSNEIVSKGIIPKYKALEKRRIKTYKYFYHNLPSVISIVKKSKLAEIYRKLNNKDSKSFALDDKCHQYLESKFKEDWNQTLSLVHNMKNVKE